MVWVLQTKELSLKYEGVTQFYINKSMHTQRTYFGYLFSLLLSLYISKTLRDFQTWIKTRPHLSCAALGHFTVGIKQKTLKLDRTFVFLSWNILLCINIIISQAPLTLVMYLLRWSSLQYWMFNWKCHIDRYLKYFFGMDIKIEVCHQDESFFFVEIFDSDIWCWKLWKTFYLFILTHKYFCW